MGRCVAIEALEFLRNIECALDHGVAVPFGLQTRFAFDCLLERYRCRRVLRHEFAELVDLPVGHLQNTADITQHAARL